MMQRTRKMAKISFVDRLKGKKEQRKVCWREQTHASSADCKVVVNCDGQAREYLLHLQMLCKSSGFFFKVATGSVQAIQFDLKDKNTMITSNQRAIQIKMQDGYTVSIGKSVDNLRDLKRHVCDTYNIPIENQRYFRIEGTDHNEIIDEWTVLSSYEEPLLLIPREPWQRFDTETNTIYLSIPKPCLDIFERILDFMYSYRCSESCLEKLGKLSPTSALGALWLTDHLDIPDLEDHLISHLERMVTPHTCHSYLATAVQLRQGPLVDALTRLASQHLECLPAEVIENLPLDVVGGLLENSSVEIFSEARGRVVVSYLQARDSEGRLVEQHFRRLMRIFVAGQSTRDSAGSEETSSGDTGLDQEDCFFWSISAEDAAALLGLARRFGDAEMPAADGARLLGAGRGGPGEAAGADDDGDAQR